jgi:hypothetical protein
MAGRYSPSVLLYLAHNATICHDFQDNSEPEVPQSRGIYGQSMRLCSQPSQWRLVMHVVILRSADRGRNVGVMHRKASLATIGSSIANGRNAVRSYLGDEYGR